MTSFSDIGAFTTIDVRRTEENERYRYRRYNRIFNTRDFQIAADKGSKVYDRFLVVNYRARGDTKATRLGIITTRRLGKAVVRNRLRRLVRESFRLALPRLKRGFDIVVIVRVKAKKADFSIIQSSFLALMMKAGLFEDARANNN
jgi:ribonuclease P protein component